MNDGEIVSLFWERDERAVSESLNRYGRYCQSIAYGILPNPQDAEECVNDACMAAWNSIPPHRPAVLSSFLGKLTRRASLKKWRSYSAQKRGGGELPAALDELRDCIPSSLTLEAEVEERELARSIDAFLQKLPSGERRAFILRYWYLESIAAIAARLGYSQSKVKSMLHRSRGKLLEHLRKEGFFNEL